MSRELEDPQVRTINVRLLIDILAFLWPIAGFYAAFKVIDFRVTTIEAKVVSMETWKDIVRSDLQTIGEKQVRLETKVDLLLQHSGIANK